MKKILLFVFSTIAICVHAKDRLTFVAFEINSKESLAKYEALFNTMDGYYLSNLEYSKFTNIVDKIYYEELEIDEASISIDKKCPVQFAKKEGEKYVLAPSDLMQGLKCEFEIEVIPSLGFMFNGSAEFFVPSKREIFTPFPNIDAGRPVNLMGGYFNHNCLIPGDKYAVICCSLQSFKHDEFNRLTGLVVLLQGDIRSQVPPESVVAPSSSKMKGLRTNGTIIKEPKAQ